MFMSLLKAVGFDLKRQVRQTVMTVVFALVGAILIALALGFGIAALYEWLKLSYGTLPALGILGGAWALLGIIFLCMAFLRPGPRQQGVAATAALQDPAVAIADATEQAVDSAAGLIREGSRKQVFGAIMIAVVAGYTLGRRL